MKEKTRKKKKTVIFLCVIGVLAIALFSFFVVAPTVHISKKYDIPVTQLKIKSIQLPKPIGSELIYLPVDISYDKQNFIGAADRNHLLGTVWEYAYNGNEYHVHFAKRMFYDDFQIDYYEKQLTDMFKENVSDNIIGVELNQDTSVGQVPIYSMLFARMVENDEFEMMLYDSKDSKSTTYSKDYVKLYYCVDDINAFEKRQINSIKEDLTAKISEFVNENQYWCHRYFIKIIDKNSGFGRYSLSGIFQDEFVTMPIDHIYYGLDIQNTSFSSNIFGFSIKV